MSRRIPTAARARSLGAFVLAAVLLLAGAPGLEARAAPPVAARPMRFERLSVEEGLSQSTVTAVLQDRTGLLWIGTQDGLNRYDGYGFEVYRSDPDDPESLPRDWILSLAEGASGDLWIGTEGGGLARWQRASDTFLRYPPEPENPAGLSGDRVLAITIDRAGMVWLGTFEAGLNVLDPATGELRRFRHDPSDPESLADDRIRDIYQDPDGNLWVGTMGGLHRFDRGREAFVRYRHDPSDPRSLSDDRVRAILQDGEGALWVGTFEGLNRLLDPGSGGDGAFDRFLSDDADPGSLSHPRVRTLFEDSGGRLWIGTDGGLDLWRPERGDFASYRHDPADPTSLASDQVVALTQDRSGILWLATIGGGLAKWNPKTWTFAHYRLAFSGADGGSNNVFAVSEDAEGGVWLGTFGGGLQRIDRVTGESRHFRHDMRDPASLGDDRVTSLLHDGDGTLWVGTISGGLNRLRRAASHVFHSSPSGGTRGSFERFVHDPTDPGSLGGDSVASLHEDSRAGLWIGTYGGGLHLHQGGGVFRRFAHDPADSQSLSNDRPISISEDAEGRLWVATDGGGLNRFHPVTQAFLRIEHDPADATSLASNELTAAHVDAEGRLWVGTKGAGVDLLEGLEETTGRARFRNYSRADGLPNETVWGIRSDAEGSLWLATNKGLSRLDPRTGALESYNATHGLQSNEFNLGSHYGSPSGELFFGGVNGFNAFFPSAIEANPHAPPVVLTSFTRVNEPVRFDQPAFDVSQVALGHRDVSFALEFAALDYTAPADNRYRYRLEGFQDTWIDNGTRRWVSFTNLDPGSYLLRVQGSNSDGVWNEQGASVAIDVAPPPWRTWWAYTLYAFALAATIGTGTFFYREHRQAERDRAVAERDRAIAERDRERVAERERLIEEREALSEERERLIEQLEQKNAELERFNYTVAHDLKSPLVTIKGFLGLMERDLDAGDRERVKHDVRRLAGAASKMHALLDKLLQLARIDHQPPEPEQVRLDALVPEALELVHGLATERGADVAVEPDLPVVTGDRLRLLEVFQNLRTNALRYMGDQEQPRIEVGARRDRQPVELYVRDNGIGIDPRFHQKIFGLFERLESDEEGTGIGLAVVRRIVELHGGKIWVESEGDGKGSTFCFTLAAPDPSGQVEMPKSA